MNTFSGGIWSVIDEVTVAALGTHLGTDACSTAGGARSVGAISSIVAIDSNLSGSLFYV